MPTRGSAGLFLRDNEARSIDMSGWETGWGLDLLVFMNNLGGRGLDLFFEPFAFIGGEYGYTIFMPILFWSINDKMGRRLYALAMSNALVNGVLKAWWARPRPFQVAPGRIEPAHIEESYGIPSGHTQGGTILGLFFASETKKRWLKGLMYLLIFLMGISRMVHGVHFLQDVLTGWILGFIVFFLFIQFEKRILPRLQKAGTGPMTALSFIPAILVLGAEYLLKGSYPATKGLLASGGALSGIFLGMVIESRTGYFRSTGQIWKRILRVPVGIIVILGFQFGLSALYHSIFPENPGFFGIFIYVIRYILTGLAGYWLAPQLFILLGLAGKRETA